MKPYIIVRANGLDKLEQFVNAAYKNGYRPLGGPLRLFHGGGGDVWFAQAMGLTRWQVRRHFRPAVFRKLKDETLQEYARIFRVSTDVLRNFQGEVDR